MELRQSCGRRFRPDGAGNLQKRVSFMMLELVGCRLEGLCAIRSKWSLPARLETRTKESNVHASMKVEKPSCKMKVIDAKLAASTD